MAVSNSAVQFWSSKRRWLAWVGTKIVWKYLQVWFGCLHARLGHLLHLFVKSWGFTLECLVLSLSPPGRTTGMRINSYYLFKNNVLGGSWNASVSVTSTAVTVPTRQDVLCQLLDRGQRCAIRGERHYERLLLSKRKHFTEHLFRVFWRS